MRLACPRDAKALGGQVTSVSPLPVLQIPTINSLPDSMFLSEASHAIGRLSARQTS
jgi:hypothetical protein